MIPEHDTPEPEVKFTDYSGLRAEALTNTGIEGVEMKQLLPERQQSELLEQIGAWFEDIKHLLPERGINIDVSRINSDGSRLDSLKNMPDQIELPPGVKLPIEVVELFDAIMQDSEDDPRLKNMNIHLALRRTGDTHTHPDNLQFHIDTDKYTIGDGGTFTRGPGRSAGKYMAFVGRPGTVMIHGKVDPKYTQQEGTALATENFRAQQVTSQLLPESVYKVAVGDVLHAAPSHEDGLLFEVSFNDPATN